MSRYYLDDARTSWQRSGFPLTLSLIVIKFILMALYSFRVPVAELFTFTTPQDWQQPWRVLTYPFTAFDIMEVLFSGITLYFFAGSLERSWGTRTFALFLALVSVVTALGLTLGAFLAGIPAWRVDSWLIIAAIVVAWATINPFESVLLWFFPVQGRWLGVIDVAIIIFTHVRVSPVLGVCALAGCGAAYLWVSQRAWGNVTHWTIRRPTRRSPQTQQSSTRRHHDDDFSWRDLNPFERIARARRKKQFERLFEDDK